MAVSAERRRQIIRERGSRCELADGKCSGRLNISHLNHEKNNSRRRMMGLPEYEADSAVRILCEKHHLLSDHVERHLENGLTPKANRWALSKILSRIIGW